jgi:hypothetical protein
MPSPHRMTGRQLHDFLRFGAEGSGVSLIAEEVRSTLVGAEVEGRSGGRAIAIVASRPFKA